MRASSRLLPLGLVGLMRGSKMFFTGMECKTRHGEQQNFDKSSSQGGGLVEEEEVDYE